MFPSVQIDIFTVQFANLRMKIFRMQQIPENKNQK
jgi:hypothetical protein